jgi:hypothetical protein
MIVNHIDRAKRYFNSRAIADDVRRTSEEFPQYLVRKVQVGVEPDTWVILVIKDNENVKGPTPLVGFVR